MTSMTAFLKTIPSVLGLILVSFSALFGQEVMKIKHSCSFSEEETEAEHYVFDASDEATKIVNTLLQANGLSANGFILKESDCKNALATTEGRKRFILYNPVFLQKIKSDKWVAYCVLAHEIAHHLNNHDLETTDPTIRKRQELEADKYAGHWLYTMNASLEQAQMGIQSIPLANETSTHPPKNARLVAVTNGWTKAKDAFEKRVGDRPITLPDVPKKQEYHEPVKQQPTQQVTAPPSYQNTSTNITLVYRGAQVYCNLGISVTIGGKIYTPQSNPYTLFDVPLGNQSYTMTGNINCGTSGWCNASGQGVVTVQENSVFYIYWQNTTLGYCQISLNAQ